MNAGPALPAGLADAPALAALAVIGLLLLRWRRLAVLAALAAVLAVATGLVPGGGGVGGTLAAGAAVPGGLRPWIERAGSLCAEVTPALLAAQLRQESGFNPRARSAAGAQGIAQFMSGTWQSWATDGDGDGVASVWHPPDAIMAQGRHMCALVEAARDGVAAGRLRGGAVELALAGYNAGFGAVQAAGGVPPYAETRDYVASITAGAAGYAAAGRATPLGEPA